MHMNAYVKKTTPLSFKNNTPPRCHLPGRVMIADLLTKAVARVLYHELLRLFDAYAASGEV